MDDREENAAMVDAIQRHADVILQKSLAEGVFIPDDYLVEKSVQRAFRLTSTSSQSAASRSARLLSPPPPPAALRAACRAHH